MARLSDLNIGTRLTAAFSIVLVLLLVAVAVAFSVLNRISHTMDQVVEDRYAQIAVSDDIKNVGAQGVIVIGRLLLSTDPAQRTRYMDDYAKVRTANTENFAKFEKMLNTDEGKAIFAEQSVARKAYGATVRKLFDLVAAGQREQAMTVYQGEMAQEQVRYYALIDKMVDYQAKAMQDDVARANEDARRSKLLMGAVAVVAILLGMLTGYSITRSITSRINGAIELAEDVAKGDLTERPLEQSRDEIGRLISALQHMVVSLHRIVSDVRHGAVTISAAAHEVAQGNADLSARTEAQASALQQTASAMEQLTAAVRMSADNANQASATAVSASQVASQGGTAVGEVVSTMNSISASSQRIGEIIGVIDGIAFQTNILALNAAVEAARAGEHGRGFAVVASEVRALAQRSAGAAKEIKSLIDASSEQVSTGNRLVTLAGSTMQQVVSGIQQVSGVVAEISASSREQSLGIEQVNAAIMQMDDTTQKNAAMVEQSTAAARALQEQASQLNDAVRTFVL
ncbi:methyl-accepting chemotaxis protein [Roseateles sp. YR242]|uniref:methyl-accepting chemotaxis protein n=1 Tax=Roseateles sp. YR242 TaxID=1855305 RepID=UPI0008C98DEB|nr:methyl-accepting chemotaxis protein [Roseateles sp. YR242]SEL84895.1 methyl-accepting chemotaxis protein [Roseateles sp. YR242]